ncbi:DUF2690 domain-containing protein [Streptomyces sp. NPDC086787]|uniref:helix-turn-helix domain-containing protein n=1 Tax=Streptomyces sp. NPDC086787 TaxID=3365759 RepID=UPI0037FD6E07
MPRWKALPDELDPQLAELTNELRRLVDRGGLSVAALADCTGYSGTSWERCLGGRLLAPKGAVVALAEATGTDPVRLTTLWERAERAWSREEAHRDTTMDAIRVSRPRAASGAPGSPNGPGAPGESGRGGRKRRTPVLLAVAAGVALVTAVLLFLTGGADGGKRNGADDQKAPSPSASRAALPAGVAGGAGAKCAGAGCTGKDAESTGCSGGDLVTTVRTAGVGTTVLEVRYSEPCGAAWARITGGARGDRVTVTVGRVERSGDITAAGDTIAYTPMVAVRDAGEARACVTLASGATGCTR